MYILQHKVAFLLISLLLMAGSGALVAYFGFNPSIDFQGGAVYELAYEENRPELDTLEQQVTTVLPNAVVQLSGTNNLLIKSTDISEADKNQIHQLLSGDGGVAVDDVRFKSLGPAFSQELVNKSFFAIALVIVLIIAFIAYAFRGISLPVSSWKYGLTAILALVHDTLIPVGVFAVLGSIFIDYQIDVLFVTAILATLGYSVNDTIVVFDRIREYLTQFYENNQYHPAGQEFVAVVAQAVRSSLRRSMITSLTTFAALVSLAVLGGSTTEPFAVVLAIGVVAGTYSSLVLAPIVLVLFEQFGPKHEQKETDNVEGEEEDSVPEDVKRFLAKQ